MKKRQLIFISLLFLHLVSRSQHWAISLVPNGRDINSLAFVGYRGMMAAGGHLKNDSLQSLLRTDDYGAFWNHNSSDCICPMVTSIAFSDSLHGFGVGVSGKLVQTLDGGYNWTIASAPVSRDFYKVVYLNTHSLIAVGGNEAYSQQTILKSTDAGATWNVKLDQAGSVFKSVCFIDTLKGFAVGDTATLFATTDGGITWQQTNLSYQSNFNAIAFINSDTGYIAGGIDTGNKVQLILQTKDGGITWNALQNQRGNCLKDISFADQNNGYAVGDSGTLITSSDGGQTWRSDTVPGTFGVESFTSVKFKNPGFGAIGSLGGRVYVYGQFLPAQAIAQGAIYNNGSLTLNALVNTNNVMDNLLFSFKRGDSTLTNPSTLFPQEFMSNSLTSTNYDVSFLLNSPGTYYYNCTVNTVDSNYRSDTLGFTIPATMPQVTTLGTSSVSNNSINLNGLVAKLPANSIVSFDYYSWVDSVVHNIAASPGLINDTLQHSISAMLTGLLPYTVYSVRAKATCGNLSMIGAENLFSLTGYATWVSTSPATGIRTDSATLNATVNYLPFPGSVWFEYSLFGDTQVYTVAASPAHVSDASLNNVSAMITGLSPVSFYKFRVKVFDSVQTIYGAYNYFFNGPEQLLVADSVNNVGFTSATLYGHIGNIHFPGNIYFTYASSNTPPTRVLASPAFVSDTLDHNVSVNLTGLIPFTNYAFTVDVIDSPLYYQSSDTVRFYTSPDSLTRLVLTTLPASGITSTTATLNGEVGHLRLPGNLSFEYWVPGGAIISATASPSTVNDTLTHQVSSSLTGLVPNTVYLFRIKLTGSFGQIYGDSVSFYNGANCIPNFDFENWTEESGTRLDNWFNIYGPALKVTPGANGSNTAVKLQSSLQGPGALLNAIPIVGNDNQPLTFTGGQAYNARPDTLTGSFAWNHLSGDSSVVLLEFKSGGQIIANQTMTFSGPNSSTFQQLKFPVRYMSGAIPDTLILAFFPGNILGNYPNYGSSLTIDNLSFGASYPPITNGGFESWSPFTFKKLDSWSYIDMYNFGFYPNPDSECVDQVSDAYHGNFAAELVNESFDGALFGAGIATTPSADAGGNVPGFALNHKPVTLNGYYKFFPQNNDTLNINCNFFRAGQYVGAATFVTATSAPSYTPFSAVCSYQSYAGTPDSASIQINTSLNVARGLSRAVIDYLQFDGFALSLPEMSSVPNNTDRIISLFPNPSNGYFNLVFTSEGDETEQLKIYDLTGRVIYETVISAKSGSNKTEFNLSDLMSGIYLLSIQSGNSFTTRRFVIHR